MLKLGIGTNLVDPVVADPVAQDITTTELYKYKIFYAEIPFLLFKYTERGDKTSK